MASLGTDAWRYNFVYKPLAQNMVRAQAASQTWRKEAIKSVLRQLRDQGRLRHIHKMRIDGLDFYIFIGSARVPWQEPTSSIGALYLQEVCSSEKILRSVSGLIGSVPQKLTSSVMFRKAAAAMLLSSFTSSSGVVLSRSGKSTKRCTPDEVVLCSTVGFFGILGRRV